MEKIKVSSASWHSDTNPNGFTVFIASLDSMARTVDGGPDLIDWLDHKLDRNLCKPCIVPSYIATDPDFDDHPGNTAVPRTAAPVSTGASSTSGTPTPGAGAPASASSDAPTDPAPSVWPASAGAAMPVRPRRGAFDLKPAPMPYSQLPEKSKALDKTMFNVLSLNLKGSKAALLSCVQSESYVQAVCVLYRHIDLAKSDRKTKAFESMSNLKHNGDVQVWQVATVVNIKELFDSHCSIMDYALHCVMKSLDGKSKSIQYKIAEDINNQEISDTTNGFDMIQSYASAMAAVGDSHTKPANFAEDNRPARKPFSKPSGGGKFGKKSGGYPSQSGGYDERKDCTWCTALAGHKFTGHNVSECRKNKAAEDEAKAKGLPPPRNPVPARANLAATDSAEPGFLHC